MGASQSSGAQSARGADVEVKTSYYELLGLERTATEEEIKKAYRRKALELHPDRNFGDVERTTALFAEVQTAYEVLSDPQERAWYDAHEGEILRGGDGGGEDHYEHNMRVTTAEDIVRMQGKFRSNVEFSDAPSGFFGFLRETFDQLAREEEHAADWEGVDVPSYPSFGHKDDTYDDVVRAFYSAWSGFATRKTFAWKDVYRLSDAPDRRVRRLMEKDNQKHRDQGIREFNDAVRALVQFVRKRDPRYTPNQQSEEERAKAQRVARKAQAERQRAANAAKVQDEAVPSWARTRDPEDEEEEEEEDIEEEHFECVACHKTFKSERQYEAHEKSKKHQKAVQALRRKMQKESKKLNLDEDVTSSGIMTPVSSDGNASEGAIDEGHIDKSDDSIADHMEQLDVKDETESEDSEDDDGTMKSAQAAGTDKTEAQEVEEDEDKDSDENDEYASRSDVEARLTGLQSSNADSRLGSETPKTEQTVDTTSAPSAPKLGKAAQKRAKKAAKQAELDQDDLKQKCVTCKAAFQTKNQLFQHIKDFNHAAPISVTKGASSGKKGKRGR